MQNDMWKTSLVKSGERQGLLMPGVPRPTHLGYMVPRNDRNSTW